MRHIFLGIGFLLGVASAACSDSGSNSGSSAAANNAGARGGASGSSAGGGAPAGTGGSTGGFPSASGGAGLVSSSGGKAGSGGDARVSGGAAGRLVDASPPGDGGDGSSPPRDAATGGDALPLCGSYPCLSTTCVGLACGAARCCETDAGPLCVHGATRCPDEPAQVTLECRAGAAPRSTKTFDTACKVDGDCDVVEHWNGCCSASVIGVASSQTSSFDTFEQVCGGQPPCGCCCDRISAQDGYTVTTPGAARAVCFAGACMAVGQPQP